MGRHTISWWNSSAVGSEEKSGGKRGSQKESGREKVTLRRSGDKLRTKARNHFVGLVQSTQFRGGGGRRGGGAGGGGGGTGLMERLLLKGEKTGADAWGRERGVPFSEVPLGERLFKGMLKHWHSVSVSKKVLQLGSEKGVTGIGNAASYHTRGPDHSRVGGESTTGVITKKKKKKIEL